MLKVFFKSLFTDWPWRTASVVYTLIRARLYLSWCYRTVKKMPLPLRRFAVADALDVIDHSPYLKGCGAAEKFQKMLEAP